MTEQSISLERLEETINVFGSFDENIRIIEGEMEVSVVSRDSMLKVSGENAENVMYAVKAIEALMSLSSRGEAINEQNVRYIIQLVRSGNESQISQLAGDVLCVTAKGRPIKAKTLGQKKYVEAIKKNVVTLGIGPAGTGKTYPGRWRRRWPPSGPRRSTASSSPVLRSRPVKSSAFCRRPAVKGRSVSAAAVRCAV